jgi:hypothetical protein
MPFFLLFSEAYLRGMKEFCNYHPDLLLSISRIIDEELVRDAQTEVCVLPCFIVIVIQ